MKTVNVSELIGDALDWAVAECEGYTATFKPNEVVYVHPNGEWHHNGNWRPSLNWAQGGPIIEREKIRLDPRESSWHAQIWCEDETEVRYCNTPLIAAMRCYVASRFGKTIDIPDCLVNL